MSTTPCTIRKGKKNRNELRLPTLYYIFADDWMDKLGWHATRAWLKFHTWVDRQDACRETDKIPYTLESVYTKLGMSKSQFYNKVIRPLWNYGLIDTEVYTASNKNGKKPVNIVVYESPFNKREAEVMELEKIRDYDTEYHSVSQAHGRKGGRPEKAVKEITLKGFQMKTFDGFHLKTQSLRTNKLNNLTNKKEETPVENFLDTIQKEVDELKQQQQTEVDQTKIRKKRKTVVVVEEQIKKYERVALLAGIEEEKVKQLSTEEWVDIAEKATQYKKDVTTVIRETKAHFDSEQKEIHKLVGALLYGVHPGWKKSIKVKPTPKEELPFQDEGEYGEAPW